MGLLKKATHNDTAFLKFGAYGFEGSGKTHVSVDIAIGLALAAKKKKVAFFDTETGSNFHLERFDKAGIELHRHRGRAYIDLLSFMREIEDEQYACAIVDSVSHVWSDLQRSFMKSKNRNFLQIQDWGILKWQWQEFTDLYVNCRQHVLLCMRAGNAYATERNEDTGRQESYVVDTKARVETEMGYEPSLFIEMIRVKKPGRNRKTKTTDKNYEIQAYVHKDRWRALQGKTIPWPTYKSFESHIKKLNLGGEHVGVSTVDSVKIFENPDRSYEKRKVAKIHALETLATVLCLAELDGTAAAKKLERNETLLQIFGVAGKTQMERLHIDDLVIGTGTLCDKFQIAHETVQIQGFDVLEILVAGKEEEPKAALGSTIPEKKTTKEEKKTDIKAVS